MAEKLIRRCFLCPPSLSLSLSLSLNLLSPSIALAFERTEGGREDEGLRRGKIPPWTDKTRFINL